MTTMPPEEGLRGQTVLVTGATGFTGSLLTRKLANAGAVVHAIARPSSSTAALDGLGVRWFRGEVFDPAVVAESMRGVSYVFHLAAAYREAKADEAANRNVHVESTRLLARTASTLPGFRRFVHVSTVGVHGHIEHPPANEDSAFRPGDVYQQTKAEAELWLRDFGRLAGLPFTVIRPAAIYGPGDRRLLKVFRMAAWPVFPILGSGRSLYHLVHVDDLTSAMLLAATRQAAAGQVFICGSSEPITLEQIARTIAGELGRTPRIVRIPAGPFFLLADACEAICRPLGLEPPLYRRRVAFYTKDRAFDVRKMRDVLGYTCRYSNEVGLAETARWYVQNGWLKPSSAVR
jgi:nucleoside-diphosphate-sugar epimerase